MMPGLTNTPQPMTWAPDRRASQQLPGLGVPLTPIDDQGLTNTYPLFKLVARDAAKNVLAQTSVVLPVSSEIELQHLPRFRHRAGGRETVARLGL